MSLCKSTNANRFEYGGLNFCALAGLTRTIDTYLKLGLADVQEYILSLSDYAYKRAAGLKQVRILGQSERKYRSGIVTLLFPQDWPITQDFLYEQCISAMPQGPGRCRLSMHYYNNTADIERFFNILESFDCR